jgi:type IV secretory pathway VirB2 component (pilin)
MTKNAYMVIYFVVMVVIIVGSDLLFFRNHFEARLIANIAIVGLFAAVYFAFLSRR